jgi:hypothetical protein
MSDAPRRSLSQLLATLLLLAEGGPTDHKNNARSHLMTRTMARLRVLACSIALAAVFGGADGGAMTASAAADPPNYDGQPVAALPILASTSPLADNASISSTYTAAHPGLPCVGKTDNPHNSGHYPGYVLVASQTACPGHAVTVTIDLYRLVFGVPQFLDRGTNVGEGLAQANARWNCPSGSTFTFIGLGYHTASGGHFPADTRNEQTVTCD